MPANMNSNNNPQVAPLIFSNAITDKKGNGSPKDASPVGKKR